MAANQEELKDVQENNRNKHHIICTVCSCLILRANDGYLVEEEVCI